MKQEISHSTTEDTVDYASVEIEAPPTKTSGSDSLSDKDSDDMMVLDFQETNGIVYYVPLPGQETNWRLHRLVGVCRMDVQSA